MTESTPVPDELVRLASAAVGRALAGVEDHRHQHEFIAHQALAAVLPAATAQARADERQRIAAEITADANEAAARESEWRYPEHCRQYVSGMRRAAVIAAEGTETAPGDEAG